MSLYPTCLHVFYDLRPCGSLDFASELARSLKEYQHILLFQEWYDSAYTMETLQQLQTEFDVRQAPISADVIERLRPDVCWVYAEDCGGFEHKLAMPTVYYSYGQDSRRFDYDLKIACSSFVAKQLNYEHVIPPFMDTRRLRSLRGRNPVKTAGILTCGNPVYPGELVMALLGGELLPPDIGVMLSVPEKYPKPIGLELAVDTYVERHKDRIAKCPIRRQALLSYLLACHVYVYGTKPGYPVPYSRSTLEAMALGLPVLCPSTGYFSEFKHGREVLFYDTFADLEHLIPKLFEESHSRVLRANAQLWASQQDACLYLPLVRKLLRSVCARKK